MSALATVATAAAGVTLRGWRADDAPALARIAGDLRVWRWMSDSFPWPYTLAHARHWVDAGHVDFGGDNYAVALDDVPIGGAGLVAGAGAARCSVEIGYFIDPAQHGRGIGSAVVAALAGLALAPAATTRVFAPVHAGNAASMRVLQKNGFVCEGRQRLAVLKAGLPIDTVTWARYREPGAQAGSG